MKTTLLQWVFVTNSLRIALASTAALPSAPLTPGCDPDRVAQALATSPPRAARFCDAFTKTATHTWHPSFIVKACAQATNGPAMLDAYYPLIDNSILTSACSSYMQAAQTSQPSPTQPEDEVVMRRPAPAQSSNGPTSFPGIPGWNSTEPNPNLEPVPSATLMPVVSINHDPTNVGNLVPQDSSALFYAEKSYTTNPYLKHMYADMNVAFSYPTVVIDESQYLQNLRCHLTVKSPEAIGGSLTWEITSKDAYNVIDKSWPRHKDLVLVINGDNCEKTKNHTRTYFLGSLGGLSWAGNTNTGQVTFIGDEIMLEEGITDASLEWGTRAHDPKKRASRRPLREVVNESLCGKASAYTMATGVPSIDPCTPSFDLALDESIGYYYTPTAARHSHSRDLLIIAEAREDVISEYAMSQMEQGTGSIELGPGIGRPGQLRDIWRNIRGAGENVWKGIGGVGDAFRRAPRKTKDVFEKMPGQLRSIGHIIWLGLEAAGRTTVDDFKKLRDGIKRSASEVKKMIIGGLDQLERLIQSWEPEINARFDIDLAPSKLTHSPWGEAWLLFKYVSKSRRPPSQAISLQSTENSIEVPTLETSEPDRKAKPPKPPNTGDPKRSVKLYCVRCGLHSHIQINGKARFSILRGVQEMNIGMNGNFEYGVNVGIDGDMSQAIHLKERKIVPPISTIPGTTIPGVLTFGPIVSMSLKLDSELHSKGRTLTGVNIGLPSFSTGLDFVNPSSSHIQGFDKLVINQFFASGRKISASASMRLPFSIGVGVIIPRIKFNQQAKMINSPAVDAQATMSGKCNEGKPPPDITLPNDPGCNGVTHSLGFEHVVTFEFFNKYRKTMTVIKYPKSKGCRQVAGGAKTALEQGKRQSVCDVSGSDDDGEFKGNSSSAVYNNRGAFWRTVPNKISIKKPTFIIDSSKTVVLVSALDGNIYMVPFNDASRLPDRGVSTAFVDLTQTGVQWIDPAAKKKFLGSHSSTVITDGYNRGFFYFPATIERWGVTRIRMLSLDEVPASAKQTIMEDGRLEKDGTKGFYFIDADSPFGALFPVVCTVKDAANRTLPKLFAVSDLDKGLASLRTNMDIASAVTGGVVKSCAFVHLQQTDSFRR